MSNTTSHLVGPHPQPLTLSLVELDRVVGGASSSPDPTSVAKRAADNKPGHGSVDIYGYGEPSNNKYGVGAEVRHRISKQWSVFGRGQVGTKDGKPDNSIMGGFRFQW